MKALSKELFIKCIEDNFKNDEIIMEEDWRLKQIWKQFGDDYFIKNNEWVLSKKSENL